MFQIYLSKSGGTKEKSLYSGSSIMNRFSSDRKNGRYMYVYLLGHEQIMPGSK